MSARGSGENVYVVTLSAGGQIAIPKFMRGPARAGERYLIVQVQDGYLLKPVRSIHLRARLERAQAAVTRAIRSSRMSEMDLDGLVQKVRRERRVTRGR